MAVDAGCSCGSLSWASSRGQGEGIGVNIGRTISNHLCGSGPTDWHHVWAGEVEETASALSCCTLETAGNLWRSLCNHEWTLANVSHLTVGAEHRQGISQHPTDWVSPALSLLRLTLLTLRPPTMVPPTVAGVGFQGCKEAVSTLQGFSQISSQKQDWPGLGIWLISPRTCTGISSSVKKRAET